MFGSLERFWGKKPEFKIVNPSEFAHLVVDVQRDFCDPRAGKYGTRQTDAVAGEIARVTPVFRKAGMPTYLIYCQKWTEPPEQAFGGFHKIQPAPDDIKFGKVMQSAFEYTDLAETLRKAGAKTLLVSGFHISACVNATVQSALREHFKVWVLNDCIGNGAQTENPAIYRKLMADNGAELMTSAQAIARLQAPAAP